MGRFEDWLRRPGAPLTDQALAAWLEENPNQGLQDLAPQLNAQRVFELERRLREWDAHRHALQEAMAASEEELHANMLSQHLEREYKDLENQLRRTPWDQRPFLGFGDEMSEITRRQVIQDNRVRTAQRRYDEAREQCMRASRPHPRGAQDWRPIKSVDDHYDRFTRRYFGPYEDLRDEHYPEGRHIADVTGDRYGRDRQEYQRRTAELSQIAKEFSETILGRHPPTCRPGMKRKFDDESRRGGGGGAGSLCT